MVKVTCPTQPNLWIPHLGVQFVDGAAEVSDETAVALAAYRVHGVEIPEGKTELARRARSRKSE